MSDLVQNARSYANSTGYMDGAGQEVRLWMHSLCDELERLTALLSQDIHSCHPNCTRSGCVNARLTRELEEARKDAARHRAAITWALGTNGEFKAQGTMDGRYWWRGELAERAGLTWNSERWVDRQGAAMSQEK